MTQHFEPAADSASIAEATASLLATAKTLSDADVLAPSLLPDWSRGHVLTHVARNADGLVNLLTWAKTGVETPMYLSRPVRNADIEAGSRRPIAECVVDIEQSHQRLVDAVEAVPADNWTTEVRLMSGEAWPASNILETRLREVAIHHLDLNAGYSASDWSPSFALRILISVVPAFEIRGIAAVTLRPTDIEATVDVAGGSSVEVRGRCSSLAAWLLGRGDGASLEVTGGELPTPPAWV